MRWIVSGEGPTDIGVCEYAADCCYGNGFRYGPMTAFIDRILETVASYSLLASSSIENIPKARLGQISRSSLPKFFSGKKRGYNTAFHFKYAWALAKIAKQKSAEENCEVGAVLFRDADGTVSTERGEFELKWESMVHGFDMEDFTCGVPMVPKPKSEGWLLCALKSSPYIACGSLENSLSGNDDSPNPAKEQLQRALESMGRHATDIVNMIEEGLIDPIRIDMPSFNRFKQRLESVARSMMGLPPSTV